MTIDSKTGNGINKVGNGLFSLNLRPLIRDIFLKMLANIRFCLGYTSANVEQQNLKELRSQCFLLFSF